MSFWVIEEGKKELRKKRDEDLDKKAKNKQKLTVPKEKQIECLKCKTLNEPNNVLCISCGENMVALKQAKIKDYSVIRKADKRRKHQ